MIKYSSFILAALLTLTGCGGGGGGGSSSSSSGGSGASSDVVINEVLADNNSTNTDPDLGLYSDWIELKNIGSSPVNLTGYGLSDSSKKIKWKFPDNTQLNPNGLLLVWADDFNTTAHPNPTALHTNFKLKSNDDKVVLYDPSGAIIASLNLKDYKVTAPDISVARDNNGGYFLSNPPTPGADNNSNAFVVSKAPKFSKREGVYQENPLPVTITAENGATICYTTDGSEPQESTGGSTTCASAPANVSLTANKTTLKAIAKEQGANKLKSKVKSKTFVIISAAERPVVINEIFADNNSSSPDTNKQTDWVELKNVTGAALDLSGYKLSDKKNLQNGNAFKALSGTISANGYKVITISKATDGFGLSDKGDSVVLYNPSDKIIDFKDFDKLKGVSLSRQGGIWDNNFTETTQMTPGQANAQQ